MPSTISDANFDSSIGSGVAVVKFSATWCGPCKAYAPTFNSVAGSRNDASFFLVDIDQSPASYSKYGGIKIPFTVVFLNGKKIDSRTGGVGSEELNQMIDKAVGKLSGPSVIQRSPSEWIGESAKDSLLTPFLSIQKTLENAASGAAFAIQNAFGSGKKSSNQSDPVVLNQDYTLPQTTRNLPDNVVKDQSKTTSTAKSISDAISSILIPIAAARQAKAAARAQNQSRVGGGPKKPEFDKNLKYALIGGGVLATMILIYAASRD